MAEHPMSNPFAVIRLWACALWLVDCMALDSRNPARLAREGDSCLVGERALNHDPSLGSATRPELGMMSPEPNEN